MKIRSKPKQPTFPPHHMHLSIDLDGGTNLGDLIRTAFKRYEQLRQDKSVLLDNYEYPAFKDEYDLLFIGSLIIEKDYWDGYYHLTIEIPLKTSFIMKEMEVYNEKLKEYEEWCEENKEAIEEEYKRRAESARKTKEEKKRKEIIQLENKLKKLKNEA